MNKTAIASVIPSLTSSWNSHQGGVVRIFSAQLKEAGIEHDILWHAGPQPVDWNQYDTIYLWQGLEMSGRLVMNLFGSQFPRYADRLRCLANFKGVVIPMLYGCYPYDHLQARNWQTTANVPDWNSGMTPRVWCNLRQVIAQAKPPCEVHPSTHVVIGDSHAPSVWVAGSHLRVHSGLTLHGILRDGLKEYVPAGYKKATLLFGQIDLRHHLCRQERPVDATYELASELFNQCAALHEDMGMNFELCTLHPVEDETRRIPTPGMYKGKPFYGSKAERNRLRIHFNEQLRSMVREQVPGSGFTLCHYPSQWQRPDGFMDEQYMEHGGSVHIAPIHYRAFRSYAY